MNIYSGNYKKFLVIPLVLYFVFAFLAFVYPGMELGKDILGGTSINVRGQSMGINLEALKTSLNSEFKLKDLEITKTGNGLIISYAKNESLDAIKTEIDSAKAMVVENPEQAKTIALSALEKLKNYYTDVPAQDLSANAFVEFVEKAFLVSKERNETKIQETISGFFPAGEKVTLNIDETPPTLGNFFWASALRVAVIAIISIIIVIFILFRQ
ncbi:MAG: hypothetical protein Q7K42_00115, partial [Candidatus Diapherotrites archaeon]|nr:hypothetical protein [Candidatus Diapherotrites archaeon]